MAFDMYAGDARERISYHEGFVFALAEECDSRYPQLVAIWRAFYGSPHLSSQQAGELVHELIDLLASHGGISNKPLPTSLFAYCRSSVRRIARGPKLGV